MFDSLSRDDVHSIITERLQGSRPIAWEEDISRNTLDEAPFEAGAVPNTFTEEDFGQRAVLQSIEQMSGQSAQDFAKRDTFAVPSASDREGYHPGDDCGYWLAGLNDYLKLQQAMAENGVQPKAVFDFGCASGRVLRHFAAQTELQQIWGSDINRRHVRWILEHLPLTVKPIFNHCIPTLPLPDASLDLISAFSVFTHIDTFETHWLAELRRVLSPNGICYLTVHNEDTWNLLADEIDNEKNRLVQSMLAIDPAVEQQLKAPMPKSRLVYRFAQSGPYRAQVFHSNEYLHRVWGRFFEIVEIKPAHHNRQTVLILKKA